MSIVTSRFARRSQWTPSREIPSWKDTCKLLFLCLNICISNGGQMLGNRLKDFDRAFSGPFSSYSLRRYNKEPNGTYPWVHCAIKQMLSSECAMYNMNRGQRTRFFYMSLEIFTFSQFFCRMQTREKFYMMKIWYYK